MNGIYYKNGIYVLIDNETDNDFCLYHHENKKNILLYGGRVNIQYSSSLTANLLVDGIPIIYYAIGKAIDEALSLSLIVSHLNAIQENGVDAFLENYKKSIDLLYSELKELILKTESQLSIEQENIKIKILLKELFRIRYLMFSVLPILFNLNAHMSTDLGNVKVVSIYNSIMNSFA